MPTLAAILTLFVYIPWDTLAEGLSQPTHSAQLGDPCSEPGDCKVPNSECVQTDNLYWNRQNFCVCQAGFHPSTGFCVADSGTENHTGMIKLDYNHHQQHTTTTSTTPSSSSSSNEDTTRNTSARSLLMTAIPPQNLLQGFHFGNRTQAIVSNLVEQLTHLRGQQQTDAMKERLETLGLPLLQPPQSFAREDSEETTTAQIVPATSADSNGYYLEVVTAPMGFGAGAFVSATTVGTTSPSTQVINAPSSTTTTTTTMAPIGNFNPFAAKPLPPPPATRVHSTSTTSAPTTTTIPSAATTPVPTMATIATPKSSGGNNNSPFQPPALPPFFNNGKTNPLKATTSSTTPTTTIPLFNVTTPPPSPPPGNPADDPEARLALLRKVQNLIVKTSPLTQRPPVASPEPSTPLNLLVPVTVIGGSKLTPTTPSTVPTTVASTPSEPAATEPVLPPAPHPPGPKSHNGHHPPSHPSGMKNVLNSLGLAKPPSQPAIPQPFAGGPPTPPPLQQPTAEFESQQQVRSTLIDHLPSVDFYAVFRSAAENVIREYLGGILTTTMVPPFPQMGQPHGMREFDLLNGATSGGGGGGGPMDTSIEKLLEKMVESKAGPGAVLLQVNNHHPHHPHPPHSHGPHQAVPTAPSLLPESKVQPVATTASPVVTTLRSSPTSALGASTPTTRPRHAFIWRSTSPGHPAHPLPRIVFTGR